MPRKAETRVVKKIMDGLKERYPDCYIRKIHGSMFQHAGIPDIIGCIHGCFVGLEVKTTDGHLSAIQVIEGQSISEADGIFGAVMDLEDALEIIQLGLIRLRALEVPRLT